MQCYLSCIVTPVPDNDFMKHVLDNKKVLSENALEIDGPFVCLF